MAFIDAERTQLYTRCALFGPSGSGKTMTGLRIAKGIAGKLRVPIAVIDTEARSATKYAGDGRFTFKVDNLKEKTIDHYLASMEEAKKAGYKVLLIDSLTHAWRELTEEVDRIALRSNSKNTFTPWAQVGPKQKKLIDAILNYPGHIIVTMRSKTEWVIGVGKDGKTAPQKLGLAPEQGKGIEYEFDLLIEIDQNHYGTITKDRTGKFQDEVIHKPGEEFGVALYEWLASGKPEIPAATTTAEEITTKPDKTATAKTISKLEKKTLVSDKPNNETSAKQPTLKEQSVVVINEIGTVISADKDGNPYFTEEEKEEARQIIRDTKLDEKGITDLKEFKTFLSDELAKRESKKAA
jgi:hypothetical protein